MTKKWNHTRARVRVASLEELTEHSPNDEPPQIPDKTNVEIAADVHILCKQTFESAAEQEREVIRLLRDTPKPTLLSGLALPKVRSRAR